MSRIPNFQRSVSKIKEADSTKPSSTQGVKRSSETQAVATFKKPKVEIPAVAVKNKVPAKGVKNRLPGGVGSRDFLKNAGFSEKAKQRALKPISENCVRGSMPAIGLASRQSGAAPKRPPWDLRGRIQDLEETLQKARFQNQTLTQELPLKEQIIAALETHNSELNKDVQIKASQTQEASTRIHTLEESLKERSEECDNILKEKVALVSEIKILNDNFNNLQNMYNQETSCLKNTITSLTCAKSGVQTQLEATQKLVESLNDEIKQLKEVLSERDGTISSLLPKIASLERKLLDEESTRRKLHNTIQELKGNIRVYCRMRPLLSEELKTGLAPAHIVTPDQKTMEVHQTSDQTGVEKTSEFSFDCVFPKSASQEEVFAEISQLVQSSIDGYNVCIFSYGQTGSGKTYTMEGPESIVDFSSYENESHLGMIPRSVRQIFKCISDLEPRGWLYKVEALFLEIYNERIQDLLSPAGSKCEILQSARKRTDCILSNVTATPVTCSQDVLSLLKKARMNRAVAATLSNEHSSRSHYVFQMKIFGENAVTGEKCEGILNLVDLAGSERVKDSGSAGDRLTEAKAINKSLSNLGNVIMSLSRKDNHIPYRDSKLTHLLANSLGGNSKTLMFVNISPCQENITETVNSLRFATKVNQCNIGTAQKRVK